MPLSTSLPSFSTKGYDCRCSCPSLDTINPNSSDAIVKNAMSLSRLPSSSSSSISSNSIINSISIFSRIISISSIIVIDYQLCALKLFNKLNSSISIVKHYTWVMMRESYPAHTIL